MAKLSSREDGLNKDQGRSSWQDDKHTREWLEPNLLLDCQYRKVTCEKCPATIWQRQNQFLTFRGPTLQKHEFGLCQAATYEEVYSANPLSETTWIKDRELKREYMCPDGSRWTIHNRYCVYPCPNCKADVYIRLTQTKLIEASGIVKKGCHLNHGCDVDELAQRTAEYLDPERTQPIVETRVGDRWKLTVFGQPIADEVSR